MNGKRIDGQTYILWIANSKKKNIHIGKLGKLTFVAGIYIYLGSAKENLRARIKRHLSDNKKKFWHIDYLLSAQGVKIREIWTSPEQQECRMAKRLYKSSYPYIEKFGSSDCRCRSHLFFINKNLKKLKRIFVKNGFKKFKT